MSTATRQEQAGTCALSLDTDKEAALYMESALSGPVRSSLEALLHHYPSDPIGFLAESLRGQQRLKQRKEGTQQRSGAAAIAHVKPAVVEAVDALYSVISQRNDNNTNGKPAHAPSPTTTPPLSLSLSLNGGRTFHVRPLSTDFARVNMRHGSRKPPLSSFPSFHYLEAASVFEVGSCLRHLQLLSPQAPLLLFIEAAAPTSTVFFYEGTPYACTPGEALSSGNATKKSPADVTADVRSALSHYGGTVQGFSEAMRTAAAEVAPAVRIEFFPPVQTDYLAMFDQVTRALDDAVVESRERAKTGQSASLTVPLPTILFVSYRAQTARLTHARLLAAYGPYFEAAQRLALRTLRQDQLERKKKFTFAFAMEYWAQVQRRRETNSSSNNNNSNSSGNGVSNTKAAAAASASAGATTKEEGVEKDGARTAAATAGRPDTPADAVDSVSTAKVLAKEKRAAARSAKRSLPTYDADQQAEDDVFLVVIRRFEHAAATLIQSVYRGHRARLLCQQKRAALPAELQRKVLYSTMKAHPENKLSFDADVAPHLPLLRASLERLYRESSSAVHDIWTNLPASPPPVSRRCWIYRPVQRIVKVNPNPPTNGTAGSVGNGYAAKSESTATAAVATPTRVREDWVQEELLIPPLRATEPRARISIAQRLVDYLAAAQCTILRDTMQLFKDSPGMSVLQRRAYDHVKSLCLTLFFVAYAELRQRGQHAVPATFAEYMREWHGEVLTWFQSPHETSLLLRTAWDQKNGEEAVRKLVVEELVRSQLRAHETFLVAQTEATTAAAALVSLSPHVFISSQPLLPFPQWVKEVAGLARIVEEYHAVSDGAATCGKTTTKGSADTAMPTIHWWSIATVPLCSVEGTTLVAAVQRCDTQQLDGAPAYDCFVPRVRSVVADVTLKEGVGARQACPPDTGAAVTGSPNVGERAMAEEVVSKWLKGDIANDADGALVKHIRTCVSREGYLECHRPATLSRVTPRPTSFIDLPYNAVLTKYTAVRSATHDVVAHMPVPIRDSVEVSSEAVEEEPLAVDDLRVSRSHSFERRDGWGRVREAVAVEAAAMRRSIQRESSALLSTPRVSVNGFGRSRHTSSQLSVSDGCSISPADSQQELNAMDGKATTTLKHEGIETSVQSVSEVASDVASGTSAATLHHTRRALRFLPGLEGAKQLDAYVHQVAGAVLVSANAPSCLVLALDVATQPFFALAAVLVDHRLRGNRDISEVPLALSPSTTTTPTRKATEETTAQPAESSITVDSDEHLHFLCGFHALLKSTLVDAASSTAAPVATLQRKPSGTNASVQLAIAHVARVLRDTAAAAASVVSPSLDLLSRLRQALQRAEAASNAAAASAEVQHFTTLAVQLAEQYTWLVLLEWYLWSSYFLLPSANDFVQIQQRSFTQAGKEFSFTDIVRTAPAVMQWIEQMDPWAAAPERCPDLLHHRYSNGLRRWDDKKYVCFGAL